MLTDAQQAEGRQLGCLHLAAFAATRACDRPRARWTSSWPGST